jgi:hypothetical protein
MQISQGSTLDPRPLRCHRQDGVPTRYYRLRWYSYIRIEWGIIQLHSGGALTVKYYVEFSAYEKVHWIDKLVAYVADLAVRKPHVKIFGACLYSPLASLPNSLPNAGICFGHQIIARALGGECVFGGKWEVGATTVHHTDIGRQIFGTPTLVS